MKKKFLRFLTIAMCFLCCFFALFACEIPNPLQNNGMTYEEIYQSAVEQGYEGTKEDLAQSIKEKYETLFLRAHPEWSMEQALNSIPEIVEIGVSSVQYNKDTGLLVLALKTNLPEIGESFSVQVLPKKFPEGVLAIKLTNEWGTKELSAENLLQDDYVQIILGEEIEIEFVFDKAITYSFNIPSCVKVLKEETLNNIDGTYSVVLKLEEIEYVSEFFYTSLSINYTRDGTSETLKLPFTIDGYRGSLKAEFLGVIKSNGDFGISNEKPSKTFIYTIGETNYIAICFNIPVKLSCIKVEGEEVYARGDLGARYYFFELRNYEEVGVYTISFDYHNDRADEWFSESFTVQTKEKDAELVDTMNLIWLSTIYNRTLRESLYANGGTNSFKIYAGQEIEVSLYMYGSEAFLTAKLDGAPIELFDVTTSVEYHGAKFIVPVIESGEHTLVLEYCIPNRTYMTSEEFSVYIENPDVVFAGIVYGSNDAPQKELTVEAGFSLYLCFNTHVSVESIKILSGDKEIECSVMHRQGSLIGAKPREDYACMYSFGCGTDIESGKYQVKLQYLYLGETVTEIFYLNFA